MSWRPEESTISVHVFTPRLFRTRSAQPDSRRLQCSQEADAPGGGANFSSKFSCVLLYVCFLTHPAEGALDNGKP